MIIQYKFLIITFIFFTGCNDIPKNHPEENNKSENGLSTIRLNKLSGDAFNLDQYKGKTVFLNFWATWCKPCLQEMPSIQQAMEKLKDEQIVFLFASNEAADQIEKFKNNHNYKFNYVKIENLEELSIMALPTTYIFSRTGKLEFSEMGYRNWNDQKNIELILNIAK